MKKTSQSQSNTLEAYNNTDFETEFVKLWVYLESTYANQKFSTIMQSATGRVARAWRMEFKKNGVKPKDLLFFRENLSLLEKPEFIPTSLTLIALLKKEVSKCCRTNLGQAKTEFLTPAEVQSRREDTQHIRANEMNKIRGVLL